MRHEEHAKTAIDAVDWAQTFCPRARAHHQNGVQRPSLRIIGSFGQGCDQAKAGAIKGWAHSHRIG